MQINLSGYDHVTTNRERHRKCYLMAPLEYLNLEQVHLYHSGNSNPTPGYTNSSISGDPDVSSVYTCFVHGMDGHLGRFCSQMQSLADCGPNANMLYPHGLPPLVNNKS